MQAQDHAVVIKPAPLIIHDEHLVCPTPGNPANPCMLAAQVDENGTKKILLSFTTQKRARGIVEFTDPQAAIAAGLPPYVTVNSQLNDCGTGSRKVGDVKVPDKLCEHTASFEISTDTYPGYRIVMRNDEDSKPGANPNPAYGKVETYVVSQGMLPITGTAKAAGEDVGRSLVIQQSPSNELAAKQHSGPPPDRQRHGGSSGGTRTASRCASGGCDLPPLEVLPQFR
jgi:hypothetical protein